MSRNDGVDASAAHPARVWDYLLGGKDNFAADRDAAESMVAASPALMHIARADRLFLANVVDRLAAGPGVRQFLDIGTGLPTADNTHEVAQRAAPESRIVYVDNDPIVLSHARSLLESDPRGQTAYIDADLRDPGTILRRAAGTLDFTRPVAVMLLGILLYLPDTEDPYGIVRQLMDAVPPGSYLAISHGASDLDPEITAASREFNERGAVLQTLRTKAEFTRFFDGLELQGPGVVTLDAWHRGEAQSGTGTLPAYCGLGRKNLDRSVGEHRHPPDYCRNLRGCMPGHPARAGGDRERDPRPAEVDIEGGGRPGMLSVVTGRPTSSRWSALRPRGYPAGYSPWRLKRPGWPPSAGCWPAT